MKKIKIDEYIIITGIKKTARIIEIYSAKEENDRIFYVYFPDGTYGYTFESEILPLNLA